MTVGSEIESLRSETQQGFARLEGQLNAYMMQHTATHAAEQGQFAQYKLDIAPAMHDLIGPPSLDARMRTLEDGRIETQTTLRTVKALLLALTGGSIMTMVGVGISVWQMLSR